MNNALSCEVTCDLLEVSWTKNDITNEFVRHFYIDSCDVNFFWRVFLENSASFWRIRCLLFCGNEIQTNTAIHLTCKNWWHFQEIVVRKSLHHMDRCKNLWKHHLWCRFLLRTPLTGHKLRWNLPVSSKAYIFGEIFVVDCSFLGGGRNT